MLRALLERAIVILVTADQAAEAVVFVIILFPRRRGLFCKLPRGIVGIFICDVIILLFCRPVKFVVGILNSLVITKRHFLQSPVVHAAFVLVFCEHDRARRRARRGVVRAADAYLRHVAEGVVREVVVYNEDYLRTWATQQAEKELSGSSDNDEPVGEGEEIIEEDSLPEDQTTDQVTADEAAVNALAEQYFAKALPSTVDDLLNIADTFDAPEGVEGVMKWDVNNIFYNYWIVGNYMIVGGDPGDDRNDININNPETIQCLEVYKALNQFFFIESDTVTYDSVIQDFIDGKTMFTIGTTDVVKRLEDAKADGSLTFNYGIARMPDVSAELQSRSLSVTGAAVINGYSEHKELADRFAAYLSEEYADGLYERSGKMPASIHAAENADNGALTIFANEYADSVSLPKMLETGNFWMQLEVLFSKVWNGEDVTTLVQQLADNMSQQLGNTEN